MSLIRLDVADFRNFNAIKFEPLTEGFNLIYGDNGSGKTSLLESIYYLSFGRSFRSHNSEHIVRKSTEKFSIFGHLKTPHDHSMPLGIERQRDGKIKIRLAGNDVGSIAELAKLLPIQLINSNCYHLIDSGPVFRRKFVDWGAFYFYPDFYRVWKDYKRILKQRNALLVRSASRQELNVWSNSLVEKAIALHQLRSNYLENLLPLLNEKFSELLPPQITWTAADLSIEYHPGWKQATSFLEVLEESLPRDLQLGRTQFGPHRADLKMTIHHLPAKDILSRGQQKLFVCAMILAQGELLYNSLKKRPIYLVDDLPSELDLTSRSNLITLLSKQEAQVFVTAVERGIFDNCSVDKPIKLFHVEHGNLTPIAE